MNACAFRRGGRAGFQFAPNPPFAAVRMALTALSLFLGLEHIADMDGVAERDRPHWDAALASINFAAHALASS
jgi:hypothetical protein